MKEAVLVKDNGRQETMRIRRFEAPDQKSALAMVKEVLGEDAVILSTRTVRSPAGRQRVEMLAALDRDIRSLAEEELAVPRPPGSPVGDGDGAGGAAPAPGGVFRRNLAVNLARRGVTAPASDADGVAGRPAVSLPAAAAPAGRPRAEEVARWREQLIASLGYHSLDLSQPRVVALVGATGVGKTTTAAKLAAWAALHQGRSVALVSMDCYRIGATDQLRTYARIMQVPCEIALKPRDLARALDRHRKRDLVIIDTSGKSPYDERHVEELARWFGTDSRVEPLLTVAATTKKEDLAATFDAYQPLGVRGLVLSKVDETRAYAVLCQQVAASRIPIACLATGQRVPEDFLLASPETVGKLFRDGWPRFLDWLRSSPANVPWQ